MADTPELSRIISLIMENPEIVGQISALVKKDTEAQKEDYDAKESTEEVIAEPKEEERAIPASVMPKNAKRNQLLGAMKPYLSQERSRAIDSMMSIAEILEMMRGK